MRLQQGFTILEVVVVIAIVGVMLSIAVGSWGGQKEKEQVRGAAEKIRSVMTAARIKALANGESQCVGVNFTNETLASSVWVEGNQTYCTFDSATNVTAWSAAASWEQLENVDLIDSTAKGAAPTTPNLGIQSFGFSPRGRATNSSILVKSKNIAVTAGLVVVVNQVTGRVRIEDCAATGMSCQ